MPSRELREGLLLSESWNRIGPEAQLLFIRLLLTVDDFGCFDGRENVIIAKCYLNGFEPAEEFPPFLTELQREGLIVRYVNRGRPFLAIPQWSHDFRFKRRFPAPPINVDVREIRYRGKYGKKIDWRNPEGFDDVSILLDLDGRAAVPQPPEWRNLSDWSPVTVRDSDSRPVTASVTESAPQSLPYSASPLPYVFKTVEPDISTSAQPLPSPGAVAPPQASVTVAQSLNITATTATANGGIHLNPDGAGWSGISEAQRLGWQEMCDNISIPDQLARAAAWLKANAKERDQYERDGTCEAFLIRWLLRESRSAAH